MVTKIRRAKSPVHCCVQGNLESATVAGFRSLVAGIGRGQSVIFDLGQVSFVDSFGLGALLGAVRRIRESGGDAVISRPCPAVRRALHLTAIDRSVAVTTSLDEAEHYFSTLPAAA
ncbi:MAG TPA: STAS domain-containing protein [Acidimicrobiales bacterium]|nr:STAS domain-containing protein [Acidimicrobiales bacterium]